MEKIKGDEKKKEKLNGEFIPSFHSWISTEKQKKNAEKLENITKNMKNEKED